MKGIAILLMVIGHVVARQFTNYQIALNDFPRSAMFLFRFIYSFHMPLLMFCSGLFALRIKDYTLKNIGNIVWKRVMRLLFPFFAAGTLKYYILGDDSYFWFLWVLFIFIMIVIFIDGLCSLLPKYQQNVSSALIIISALLVQIFHGKYACFGQLPFLDLWHTNMYPYFCMGVICARYDLCTKWFSKNWVYTISLLVFGFLTYLITIKGFHVLPKQSWTGCLLPISAIVMLVYLFKEGLSEDTKPVVWLQNLGRHSLEIYIIHIFFCLRMPFIGNYIKGLASAGDGVTIFFIQTVTSFVMSIVIIYLSYIVMNVY